MAASPPSRAGIVAFLIGWVAVIVVARGHRSPETWLGVDNVELILFGAVAVLMIAGLAILTNLRHLSGWRVPERQSRGSSLILMVLFLAVVVWTPQVLDEISTIEESLRSTAEPTVGLSSEEAAPDRTPVAQTTDIVLLLVLLTITATVSMWFRRRQLEPMVDDADVEPTITTAEAAAALTIASRTLQLSDDPRTAVLRAYAILEQSAAEVEVGRRPAETPAEHMTRWLKGVAVDSGPVLELGSLYERARFSEFSMDNSDRQRAAIALATALEGLSAQR